jgi:hypothetical protein
MRIARPLVVTAALGYAFLMIALLFILVAVAPSFELAKWWTTLLVVGLIVIIVIGMSFEPDEIRNPGSTRRHFRTQNPYDLDSRYRSSPDWKHKKKLEA